MYDTRKRSFICKMCTWPFIQNDIYLLIKFLKVETFGSVLLVSLCKIAIRVPSVTFIWSLV